MASDKVTVALRRTYGYQGTYYGPGEAVEVPQGLADTLGLKPASEGSGKKAKETVKAAPTEASADSLEITNGGEPKAAEASVEKPKAAAKKSGAKRAKGKK